MVGRSLADGVGDGTTEVSTLQAVNVEDNAINNMRLKKEGGLLVCFVNIRAPYLTIWKYASRLLWLFAMYYYKEIRFS